MTRTCAPRTQRFGAWLIDSALVFLLWYLCTGSDLETVNVLMQTLDPTQPGALNQFAQAIFKMLTAFGLKAAFCQTAYYCLVPALLGRGRTIGKLLLRLRVADAAVPGEVSPSRLVLREFVGRTLLESLLVLPGLASAVLALFSSEGRTLRRLMTLAYAMIFTLPGIPSIYYGDEIGMQGYKDPFNRAFFDWESRETRIRPVLQNLAALRKSCPAFADGTLAVTQAQGGVLCYERRAEAAVAAVCINRTEQQVRTVLLGRTVEVQPCSFAVVTDPE